MLKNFLLRDKIFIFTKGIPELHMCCQKRIPGIRLTALFVFMFWGMQYLQGQHSGTPQNLTSVCIGFYNVENLFDTIPQSGEADFEFTPQGANNWNSEKYFEKLDRIAEVISKIGLEHAPDGPAIIGLCEIENAEVLMDLVKQDRIKDRNYQVVFMRGRDRRVNNAFLYNPRYFELKATASVPVILDNPEFRTRDHLVMSGELMGEPMHFIVSHWPSRSGGERRSLPGRIAAAEVARAAIDSIKALDVNAKIIIMGDFNDDPTDPSVMLYLRSGGDRSNLEPGQLYNPFIHKYKMGIGSLAYRDAWNLFDQILVSQSLLAENPGAFRFLRAEVFNESFLRQPIGRYKDYPFRSFGGGVYLGGYSDHFPTYIFLIREVK
jgi:endonuclease/exonuclease/phosphatase family metal-dependent hydrolase